MIQSKIRGRTNESLPDGFLHGGWRLPALLAFACCLFAAGPDQTLADSSGTGGALPWRRGQGVSSASPWGSGRSGLQACIPANRRVRVELRRRPLDLPVAGIAGGALLQEGVDVAEHHHVFVFDAETGAALANMGWTVGEGDAGEVFDDAANAPVYDPRPLDALEMTWGEYQGRRTPTGPLRKTPATGCSTTPTTCRGKRGTRSTSGSLPDC